MTQEQLERVTAFHQYGALGIYLLTAPTPPTTRQLKAFKDSKPTAVFGENGTTVFDVTR